MGAREVVISNFWEQLNKVEALLDLLTEVATEMENEHELNTAMTCRQLQYAADKVRAAQDKYQRDVIKNPHAAIDRAYEKDLS